ncbi:MAG: AmmeMemoRadiSam system protein B [Armatimonadota bacterium]
MRKAATLFGLAAAGLALVGLLSCSRHSSGDPAVPGGPGGAPAAVRPAAVAGQFYRGDARELRAHVDELLEGAKPADVKGELVALIVPHAGHEYSGHVAASAYAVLKGREYDTVIIVGPSHHVGVEGGALSGAQEWETPLGRVPLDRALCDVLDGEGGLHVAEPAHASEHSIEVQLPFLQTVLGEFALVPIVMSEFAEDVCASIAQVLAATIEGSPDKRILLVASSDLSHYPSQSLATKVDQETLAAIQTLDPRKVLDNEERALVLYPRTVSCALCGLGPVVTVMGAAKALGADSATVIEYQNSGDVDPDTRARCVGYGAVALCRAGGGTRPVAVEPAATGWVELDRAQQGKLLKLARDTLATFVTTGRVVTINEDDERLLKPAGCFVTLKREGALRGCIGHMATDRPLADNVQEMTLAAAFQDPRFRPVKPDELDHITIEISVLSPLRKAARPEEVEVGKHGVVVQQGRRQGVFLPQVATENGWDRETFLTKLCEEKAGLPADAWKKDANLWLFTAQVFAEKE